ncbi:hypothetical protein BH11ACT8_BH11ACT8_32910 [soil metagenome]
MSSKGFPVLLLARARWAAIVLALVSGLLVSSTGAATSLSPAGRAGSSARPEVGDCHDLTAEESPDLADPDPAVSCTQRHTSRTLVVLDVPRSTKMGNKEAISRLVSKRCTPVWRSTLGGSVKTRYLASYSQSYFLPTKAQQRKGARWLRCDLVLWAGDRLAPLPTDDVPALGKPPHPDAVAKCHLGKRDYYAVTVCARAHASRSKGIFTMRGKAYPSQQARYRAAQKKCPRFTGRIPWRVFYPSESQWQVGFKLFLCDAQTKR